MCARAAKGVPWAPYCRFFTIEHTRMSRRRGGEEGGRRGGEWGSGEGRGGEKGGGCEKARSGRAGGVAREKKAVRRVVDFGTEQIFDEKRTFRRIGLIG